MNSLDVLGSKARLKILRALSRRDMYVSEPMKVLGTDGKTATHHLETLTEAGLLETCSDGIRRYYALACDVRLEVSPSPERRFVVQFPPQS